MKRAAIMLTLSLLPRFVAAQDLDVKGLVGEDWYGLYLNGQKSGYAVDSIAIEKDGSVSFVEDAHFRIIMQGVRQDMRVFSKRIYAPDGPLKTITSEVTDPAATTRFLCTVDGDTMTLKRNVGKETKEVKLPRPKESLEDALKHIRMLKPGAQIGDSITYTFFEPLWEKEIEVSSRITNVEDRILEGVPTKVYQIKTALPAVNLESVSYVTQDGKTLEDIVSGMIKKRLEPEQVAKDVSYSNDVIVSNAAMVKAPIKNPRTREELKLHLLGPLSQTHLFNDERQYLQPNGNGFDFVGHRISLEGVEIAQVPITNEDVKQWIQPTAFVQSDNPKLIEQSKAIVGNETNALKISEKLCDWVYNNVHTTFSARLTNALEVLENRQGDCTEHSILFVALARAAGLPAREVAGLIYVEGPQPGFYFHQWASVWVGKWIDVDPTFDQPLADVTHIKLAEGDLFAQTRLIPIIGQITVETVEDAPAP